MQFASADRVYSALTAASLDLTEAEFSRLMQAAAGSASWEEGRRVLRAMGRELTVLQRSTLDRIAAFFASERAAAAFGGGAGAGGWGGLGWGDVCGWWLGDWVGGCAHLEQRVCAGA